MRSTLIIVLGLLTGCVSTTAQSTTSVSVSPTVTTVAATVTTPPPVPYDIHDCSAPPVTFAVLCEAFDLINAYHVDRPFEPAALAAAAVVGLQGFETDETEAAPRTLICALPDPSFEGLCAEMADRIRFDQVPVAPAMEAAVTGMIRLGTDPFTYYLPPEFLETIREDGVIEGVGLLVDAVDAIGSRCVTVAAACPLSVVTVIVGSPADEAGVMPGDIVDTVDGEPVQGQDVLEAALAIGGDGEGTVTLGVLRDGEPLQVVIERGGFTFPTVEYAVVAPDVGYLSIPDFEEEIPDLVSDALAALIEEGARQIVLDLRDNPGGFLVAAVEVASEFIANGPVGILRIPGEDDLVLEAQDGGSATALPVTVVVNEGTASAAELLAAALRDTRGAPIVGTATFGKGAGQLPFTLRNDGELRVTVLHWFSPSGDTVAIHGLEPDTVVTFLPHLTPAEIVDLVLSPGP